MSYLSFVENSFIQQHTLLKGITEKLGLSMSLSDEGWVVKDHQQHALIMTTRQIPGEIGALEAKLRQVFFSSVLI